MDWRCPKCDHENYDYIEKRCEGYEGEEVKCGDCGVEFTVKFEEVKKETPTYPLLEGIKLNIPKLLKETMEYAEKQKGQP